MVRILKLQKKGYPLQSNQFDQVKYCCIFQHVAYTETDALGQSALLQVLFKPNRKKSGLHKPLFRFIGFLSRYPITSSFSSLKY